ncbi:MAG: Succinate dehydrogenase cytochrome b558 subunit [Phycisphaerae bacterium]|nr:Succinate dehydrogenase cytochrome b558 subunit [Phycisphaerae bacterium]
MNQSTEVSGRGLERYHFALRRLHSLTGVIPIGAFLIEHMLTNFGVVVGGPTKYNEDVSLIHRIPWLAVVEWVFIFLPIAFHAGYGMFITFTGKSNVRIYPYGGNIRYTLQRIAGVFLLVFIIVHMASYRFNYLLPGGEVFSAEHAARITAEHLTNPWIVGFYVLGVLSAVFHFSNGLWTFLITWGVTLGPAAQRKSGFVCAAIGAALGVMGISSLFWFHFHTLT